jgi:tetratricopeptide (TPR) repeat protein
VLQALGRLDDAENAFQQALELFSRQVKTTADQSVAIVHNNMAMLMHDQGKLKDSEKHYKAALLATKIAGGVETPLYGIFCKNLACLEQDKGAHHRALNLLKLASHNIANSLGNRHLEYSFIESRLGVSNYRLGRLLEARHHFQSSFEIASLHFSKAHPEYLLAEGNLKSTIKKIALTVPSDKY